MELEQPSQIKTDPKQYKYHAFISYRHADNKVLGRQWATWLHHAIETYEVPTDLVGKRTARCEQRGRFSIPSILQK